MDQTLSRVCLTEAVTDISDYAFVFHDDIDDTSDVPSSITFIFIPS